jgi:hypothetical protein
LVLTFALKYAISSCFWRVLNRLNQELIKINLLLFKWRRNKVFVQIKKIKNLKMIVRVIFAIILIGLSADLIAAQGLYQVFFYLCQN